MSLRDQLKKANLLSDKDRRRLEHEARIERTEKGREQLEREQQDKTRQLQEIAAADRARIQQEQKAVEKARAEQQEAAAVTAILLAAQKPGPGPVRFYFEAADGSLPWLEVSPREAQELRAGQLCVVRAAGGGTHDYRVLGLELTRRVARTCPEVVVLAPRGTIPTS